MLCESQARMVLSALPEFGPVSIRRLVKAFGSAQAVLAADSNALKAWCRPQKAGILGKWQYHFDCEREELLLNEHNAAWRIEGEEGYPRGLSQLEDAPVGLYVRGRQARLGSSVAVIGTREPSQYGRKIARELSVALAAQGFAVVSGLARGIDTEAHHAVLEAGGKTAAVLGSGLDCLYPPENRGLADQIAGSGGVWTEFYFGRKADRQTFPQRNRIVAGMSEAVVVIESGMRGGSMITARFALEQGKTVFAVPGRVDQANSAGCHALIRDGATLCRGVEDILEELKYRPLQLDLPTVSERSAQPLTEEVMQSLDRREWMVLDWLQDGSRVHPEEMAEKLKLQAFEVSATLMMLEIKGLIAKCADGTFERAY